MKWFKHNEFDGKRDYECTNVCYCHAPEAPDVNWVEIPPHGDMPKYTTMTRLWRVGDAEFYGWL